MTYRKVYKVWKSLILIKSKYKKMKTKQTLVSLTAVLALVLVLIPSINAFVPESELYLTVRGVYVSPVDSISAFAGETLPLKVIFTPDTDVENVRVKAWISGYRSDVEVETERFDIVDGSLYTIPLSLGLPTDLEADEEYTLVVRVESKRKKVEEEYTLRVQRESYNLEILSVETQNSVVAGNELDVEIVVKNRGSHRLDDVYVTARIPSLNVEKRAYFDDLTPEDECDDNEDSDDCDKEDAEERTLSLKIPVDAVAGTHMLEVVAYNSDATAKFARNLVVVSAEDESRVLSAITSQSVRVGEEATFELIVINPGKKMKVYEIIPETETGLSVSVSQPIITVPADSSKVVKLKASADRQGTYSFGVNVNSDGKLVRRVAFSLDATGKRITEGVAVLTIVLAIIFVVLLIVLIVLLTRKPRRIEESGEAYY